MFKLYLRIGALSAGAAVLLGAFGAHYLKRLLGEEALKSFHTGVDYQFYHSFAIMITGLMLRRYPTKWLIQAGRLFTAGIILFSGSLYLITALKGAGEENIGALGLVTPLGGVLFVAGWVCVAVGVPRSSHKHGGKEE